MNAEIRLIEILEADAWFMSLVEAAAAVAPPDWLVAAGVIRTVVWDRLHEYPSRTPVEDVDLVYFDPDDLSRSVEEDLQRHLEEVLPESWDVKNQAAVHLWYEDRFGHPIPPVVSIEDAVSRFPEPATCVGVRLTEAGGLEVVAPLGLDDLMSMRLRRNPKQVTEAYFRERLQTKRISEKWPKVEVFSGATGPPLASRLPLPSNPR